MGCIGGIVIVVGVASVHWYRHQCLLRERAQIMRDAIRHRDFSFRLPTRGLFFGEKALQEALNDMGQEIQKLVARGEVESWQKLTRVLTHEIMNATTPIQSISQA
ncbi:MAG: sensor histidine kinase, partial [Bacteroidaceae bacterium]|nr:sensor histidine kinase [Bacteroidaceae bacterium]